MTMGYAALYLSYDSELPSPQRRSIETNRTVFTKVSYAWQY